MKKLSNYRKLDFQTISVQYGNELITFNLNSELRINDDDLQGELITQPKYYGFLLLLQKKLTTEFEILKQRRKTIWAKLYLRAKGKMIEGTARQYTEEMAKSWADSHKDFQRITSQCIAAKDDADTIFAAVKAFEQRKDILQTLSSNNRKQF